MKREALPMARKKLRIAAHALAVMAALAVVAGCESTTSSITKKIDYKSAQTAPALELPPDLIAPQYDDRFAVTTASGLAAQGNRPKGPETIAPTCTLSTGWTVPVEFTTAVMSPRVTGTCR